MQKFFLLCLLGLIFNLNSTAQKLENLLFSNQNVDKKLLELTVSPQFDNQYFLIGIVKNNQVFPKEFYAKKGTHLYDLRDLPNWEGRVDHIATTLPRVAIQNNRLRTPSILEELKLVAVGEQFSPKIINFQKPRILFGYPLAISLLIILMIIGLLSYFISKQSLLLSAFIGFIIASLFFDMKNIFVHKEIIEHTEQTFPYIAPLTIPQKFLQQVYPIIGAGFWTFQGNISEEYYKLFIKYELTDRYYVPNTGKLLPKNTYIITGRPKQNQKVLVQEGNLYLAKQL